MKKIKKQRKEKQSNTNRRKRWKEMWGFLFLLVKCIIHCFLSVTVINRFFCQYCQKNEKKKKVKLEFAEYNKKKISQSLLFISQQKWILKCFFLLKKKERTTLKTKGTWTRVVVQANATENYSFFFICTNEIGMKQQNSYAPT